MDYAFIVLPKKSSISPKSSRFSPMLSSRYFRILHFTCRPMIHFQLIFEGVNSMSTFFFFFACEYTSGTAERKRWIGLGMNWMWHGASVPSSRCTTISEPQCVHQPRSSLRHFLTVFKLSMFSSQPQQNVGSRGQGLFLFCLLYLLCLSHILKINKY